MQLLIKYMHFVPERLKCCAWFTGLTVLINLSVLNKRGLVFILGSVSHCYGGSGFRGVWTKLRGWCSLDLLSVVRSPFCRHKKKKKNPPRQSASSDAVGHRLLMHGDATEPLCLPAAFVHSRAVRRPFEQPGMWLSEFVSQMAPRAKFRYLVPGKEQSWGLLPIWFVFVQGEEREKNNKKGGGRSRQSVVHQ